MDLTGGATASGGMAVAHRHHKEDPCHADDADATAWPPSHTR
ncbi:MAG TPA: hypothetical protein VFS64_04970 [Solirubrobacterales bacterium]|nr:hypothetical protein [Solirubrobacterales bacterium]